jgi:plasmid stabilization system protein ParE
MTVNQGFKLHPGAVQDITEIWDFIAEDSPVSANRVSDEILVAIGNLVAFPYQGHIRSDLTSRPLRFLVVRAFLVAYAPDEKPIVVVAVLHGRRNPRLLRAILRERYIVLPDLEF